jgi:hypothetical protein
MDSSNRIRTSTSIDDRNRILVPHPVGAGLDIVDVVDYASIRDLRGIIRAKKPARDEKSGDVSRVGQAHESGHPAWLRLSNPYANNRMNRLKGGAS